jgi:tRNA(Ile)-lysidine synthase
MPSVKNLIQKAADTIIRYSMLSKGDKVLVGLSGGPDSVCLLHILSILKDSHDLSLHAIYIDHLLRPGETGAEIEFCRNLCGKSEVPFITKSADVKTFAKEQGMSVQEAARELRYRIYNETLYEINGHKIALGHNANDQSETLIMRLSRGSGPSGLGGIPPVRGCIIRPLILSDRTEIEEFLEKNAIKYIVDSSNLKKDYLRNRIRMTLIPILMEINPNINGTMSQTAEIFREEEQYFEIIVTKALMKLISRKTDDRIELFVSPFGNMDKVIMRRVLRRAVDATKGLRGISFVHIEDIMRLIRDGQSGDRIYLPKNIRVIKEYATVIITAEPPAKLTARSLDVPGEVVMKEACMILKSSLTDSREQIEFGKSRIFLDAERMEFPLTIRHRRNGDFFYPAGFGRRKKLQDFFVDEKVPRDERDRVPVVLSGEDIIWITGYRGDERFRVTERTNKFLVLETRVAK